MKPKWETSRGMVSSGGFLYQHGLKASEELNLQPAVILMSAFARWSTAAANENLYANGVSNSLYGGYMRNEQYPLGIKFFDDCGKFTSTFPLTHRPPTTTEEEDISSDPTYAGDVDSVLEYDKECEEVSRIKRWQFYNTASLLPPSACEEYDDTDFVETAPEIVETSCKILVPTINTPGNYTFVPPEDFTDFVTFVNQYKTEICDVTSIYYDAYLCSVISDTYPGTTCTPVVPDGCDTLTLIDQEVDLNNAEDETIVNNGKPLNDYAKREPVEFCDVYDKNAACGLQEDTDFVTNFIDNITPAPTPPQTSTAYLRNPLGSILNCSTPQTIPSITATNGYYIDYIGDNTLSNLQDTRDVSCVSGGFTSKLHVNALWFEFDFNGQNTALLEVIRGTSCVDDEIFNNREIRVSTFTNCAATASTECFIVDLDDGLIQELDNSMYGGANKILIAIDAPIRTASYTVAPNTRYFIEPPCGCFSLIRRPYEYLNTTVSWSALQLLKTMNYTMSCVYRIPVVKDCEVVPYKEGKFGYWESTRTYPDNKELYDASSLEVDPNEIPAAIKTEFEDYFTNAGATDPNGNYILTDDTKLYCQPIRHYKMPGNEVAPFMTDFTLPSFQDSLIFPLGVKLDNTVVNYFLDVAANSGLITQDQRDSIVGYEIVRGDRTLDKSIIAKGLLYDTYKYQDQSGKDIFYPNYPYKLLWKR